VRQVFCAGNEVSSKTVVRGHLGLLEPLALTGSFTPACHRTRYRCGIPVVVAGSDA
jgi:hypothetical protein